MDAVGRYRPDTHTQMKKSAHRALSAALTLSTALALSSLAYSHAFPIRSEPRVGWTIASPPSRVTIWFDGELEPAFSTITVYNSAKQQVDKGNSHLDPSNPTILQVDLSSIGPGLYHVYWKVLAKDTHITEGDFSFTVSAQSK